MGLPKLIGPLKPGDTLTEEQARAQPDTTSDAVTYGDDLGVPDPGHLGARLGYFGQLSQADANHMNRTGFSYPEYAAMIKAGQSALAGSIARAEGEKAKDAVRKKHGYGVLPGDTILEKDIGLIPGEAPEQPLGLGQGAPQHGGNPSAWADAMQAFGLPMSAAGQLAPEFQAQHAETEKISAQKMLEEYLQAQDLQRAMEQTKRQLQNSIVPQPYNPAGQLGRMTTPDGGTRG